MGSIGPWQIVLIVLVILLLFGGRKIPELMKGLGKGINEFKKASSEKDDKKEDTQS
ncbi:MAG TPA: twin-arginine translocase TatA/TatE family subunit [Flavobacteriales bacterium]|jgi:sec-independent protein translocase protein TatA|nr:twin-arginine translocase TatA/TatE family subunit [Salibacteraceae bacterium]HAS36725.1 twin-arginine translocase TatA/TatE family subunit [Flavobacteriales bacterium]